jgi:hypothetical protein
MMARQFRLKIRPGRSFFTYTSSPDQTPVSASAGDEVVVSEDVAAELIRDRAAYVIEVIHVDPDPADE